MAEEPNKDTSGAPEPKLPEQFEIAVLPLQNTTLFPETVVPLSVGRDRSVKADLQRWGKIIKDSGIEKSQL